MNYGKLNKVIKLMKVSQLTLKELRITEEEIRVIKQLGNRVKYHYDPSVEDYVYYIITKDDMAYIKISEESDEEQTLKLLEISDLHAGCDKFDYESLDRTLKEAVKRGIEFVHISGDIIDGHKVYRGQERVLQYPSAEQQVDLILEIFSKYDLWYIISKGNHDDSFSIDGSYDPVRVLELKMARRGKKVTYLDSYEANIIHAGVVFRLIHLSRGPARSKTYKGQIYLSNVFDSTLNDIELGGKTYNLRSVQAGHYHIRNTFKVGGVDIIMPGNFQRDGDLTKRMGISGKTGGVMRTIVIYKGQIIDQIQEFYVIS